MCREREREELQRKNHKEFNVFSIFVWTAADLVLMTCCESLLDNIFIVQNWPSYRSYLWWLWHTLKSFSYWLFHTAAWYSILSGHLIGHKIKIKSVNPSQHSRSVVVVMWYDKKGMRKTFPVFLWKWAKKRASHLFKPIIYETILVVFFLPSLLSDALHTYISLGKAAIIDYLALPSHRFPPPVEVSVSHQIFRQQIL